jgi:hypothetical protein
VSEELNPNWPFYSGAKGWPAGQGGGLPAMEFKHTSPLSTKEHWGEPKQKEEKERILWPDDHIMATRLSILSKFPQTLSPTLTCPLDVPPKENKVKPPFHFPFLNSFISF